MQMRVFEKDIAVDIGTSSVLMFTRNEGVVLHEPTVVAVDKISGKIVALGEDAKKTLGRTPANMVAINPIVSGVISDYDMTARMLKEYLGRITSFSFFRPRVLICVPGSITGVEERAIVDACIEAGARKVYLKETSVATALGAGIDVTRPDGHLIIDIGGGTTDIAVVSLGGVVESESIKVAGTAFDEAIIRYIRQKYNVLIGLKTAEELKISIGCLYPREEILREEVKGRCLATGMPKSVVISSEEILQALEEPAARILEAVHMVLERTPPELVGDIAHNGIVMSGGGSLLYGIDRLIYASTKIDVAVVEDPVSCAVYGAGRALKDLNDMPDGMINLARRKQMSGK